MGRRSKATLARLNNFSKPINPQNPTVEEVFDDENTHFEDKDEDFLEHGFFFLDEEQPPLATKRTKRTMRRVQMRGRKKKLLLPSVIIHTA